MVARYGSKKAIQAYQRPGSKPIFSADQANRDLDALNEFGLVTKQTYDSQHKDIKEAETHPFAADLMFDEAPKALSLNDPKGWTGETKMCRDITTHVNGLGADGYAQLNTLKCCSYLCSKSQYQTLRDGELIWGLGGFNRYSSAVPTPATAQLADGTERYLCRTCAWDPEPSWAELDMDKLPKMEGHLSTQPADADADAAAA